LLLWHYMTAWHVLLTAASLCCGTAAEAAPSGSDAGRASDSCTNELATVCGAARAATKGNCLVCTGRHQPQLRRAGCRVATLDAWCSGLPRPNKRNLLMIISDQHRWDCLGAAGNAVIRTPNLDQLAREGAHFTKAYSVCPVCCPSRTSMLSGLTPEQNQVKGNRGISAAPRQMTYDRVLLANGWSGEYHGKYHSPYNYTRNVLGQTFYSQPVRWLNGGTTPINPPTGVQALADAYRSYMDQHEPLIPLQRGQLLDGMYRRPYWADVADKRYNQTFNDSLLALSNKLISEGHANEIPTTDQQHVNGRLALAANHSYSALTLNDALAALDRLKDVPFTLTASFEAPHPPFIIPFPYYGLYDNGTIPDPTTVEDPMTASPYHHPHSPSGDEAQVRQQRSNYYGMIAQNDAMVGKLVSKLEEYAITSRTLVVYISDHGEMLGDHHMQSKMVFYEGSVHIPLIMRLPGLIPARTVVDDPVSNMALFGTILDYMGLPEQAPSTSVSLRPLIESTHNNSAGTHVVFSFWDSDVSPGFMAYDGRFKLMIGRKEFPFAPSPPPAPSPHPHPPQECAEDLRKFCPLPFKSYTDCLACTRAHAELPICKPKQRQSYCSSNGTAATPRNETLEAERANTDGTMCIAPGHPNIDEDYSTVPCGVDEQGFDAPGVDALYDLRYDPNEVINLLRSPYAQQPLSRLHPSDKDGVVPHDKALSLQKMLASWLQKTGSEYASAVAKRFMNTSHINQVPLLTAAMPDATWRVGQLSNLNLPLGLFMDVDGDTLAYHGTLDRATPPPWMQIHDDGSVHGRPVKVGKHLLRVIASDRKSGSAFVELTVRVVAGAEP
jgi:arylsulfatase A-like enzyme